MPVPKCKECNCIWDIPVADHSNKNKHFCHWWCMTDFKGNGGSIDISKTGHIATDGKAITSQDYQKSPKWCPLRNIEEDKIREHVEKLVKKFNNSLFLKYK